MLRILLVLAVLVPGLVAAFTSQFAALLLYVWFALFRPQGWVWIDITSLRLSLILGLLVLVPRGWFASRRSPQTAVGESSLPNLTHPLSIGALVFLGVALLAQQYAVDRAVGWQWLDYFWRVLLVSLVSVSLVSTERRFTLLVAVVGLSIALHSASGGVVSLLQGGSRILVGYGGAFSDSNGYALAIVMTLPLLVAVAQNYRQRWIQIVFGALFLASAYAVVCTFSRAGFLALVAASCTFLALQRRRVVAVLAIAPLALALLLVIPSGYTDRLHTIRTYEQIGEGSALSRLHFWRVALVMAEHNPLGIGLQNYQAAYDRYDFSGGLYGQARAVHNSHLQVLAETGYLGLAVYVGMFLCAFWLALRARSRASDDRASPERQRFLFTMSNALLASMVGFLVGGSFIALALNDLTWMTFGLVAALDRLSARHEAVTAQDEAPVASRARVTFGGATPEFGGFVPRSARLETELARHHTPARVGSGGTPRFM